MDRDGGVAKIIGLVKPSASVVPIAQTLAGPPNTVMHGGADQ